MPGTHCLGGKTIAAINVAADKEAIQFILADGSTVIARCDADCCSHTFIESIEAPAFGFPATVVKAVELDWDKEPLSDEEYECLQFYGFKIETDKGDIVIDYRNSSNGYYGGSLVWPDDESYFYGGVHGQNISKEEWKPLVEAFNH
jgi:hypothetical protein